MMTDVNNFHENGNAVEGVVTGRAGSGLVVGKESRYNFFWIGNVKGTGGVPI